MELTQTLSQSGALSSAHHKIFEGTFCASLRRPEFSYPDIQRRTFADAHVARRFHPDNGR
jgi:hypothetical protein